MNNIKSDIGILESYYQDGRFRSITLEQAGIFITRKQEYKTIKTEDPQSYAQYKQLIKQLREAKMPYRIVDRAKKEFKSSSGLSINLSNQLSKLSKETFSNKNLRKLFEQKLYKMAQDHEQASSLLETICWVHGSNSSVLPILPHTNNGLVPTRILLDRGIAPMSGEITLGGMDATIGISQRAISAYTVENIEKSWDYAIKNGRRFHFSEPTETDIEKALDNLLDKFSDLNGSGWEEAYINLLRYKQWHPNKFEEFLSNKHEQIIRIKETCLSAACPMEHAFIKLLELSKLPINDESTKEKIRSYKSDYSEYFKYKSWMIEEPNLWTRDIFFTYIDFFNETENNLFYRRRCLTEDSFAFALRFICLCDEALKEIKERVNIARPISSYLESLHNQSRSEFKEELINDYQLYDDWKLGEKIIKNYGEISKEAVVNKILEKTNAIISNKNRLYQRRLDRLDRLFSDKPFITLTESEKNLIIKPFPILFGSTKKNAQEYGNEYILNEAKLGDDIDLIFVEEGDKQKMNAFLEMNNLKDRVQVLDSKLIEEMKLMPRLPASYQVMNNDLLLNQDSQKTLRKQLNEWVFPLYKAPYSGGEARKYHGVIHAARTMVFSQLLMELYKNQGMVITSPPGDLQLAAAMHDNARENDGRDMWDLQSGQNFAKLMKEKLGRSEEVANKMAAWIAEKDTKDPISLEQKIVHDSDCIEIIRCIFSFDDFNASQLWITKDIKDQSVVNELISEAKRMIKLTENQVIKDFIENSADPYACLLQVIRAAKNFPLTEGHLFHAFKLLVGPTENLLTREIEQQIIKIDTK